MVPERPFKALDGRACRAKASSVTRKKVLFICTRNSVRSQMAEAWLNAHHGERYEAYSAGVRPGKLDPLVIDVMSELGVDVSKARSKSIEEMLELYFDIVVTVCDSAREECPIYPGGTELMHKGFEDPSSYDGTPEERVQKYRQVRDEIRAWIDSTFV